MVNPVIKISNTFDTFLISLESVKSWKILAISVSFAIIYNIGSATILDDLFQVKLQTTWLDDLSFPAKFILVIFAGPILETMLFQVLIIETSCAILPKHKWVGLFLSAVLFALVHSYSNAYILFAFIPGLILGSLYLIYRHSDRHPFTMVCLAHAIINLYSFIHNSFV